MIITANQISGAQFAVAVSTGNHRKRIDGQSKTSQAPSSKGQLLAPDALEEHAANAEEDDVEEQIETLRAGSVEEGDEWPVCFDDGVERTDAEKHGDEHYEAEEDVADLGKESSAPGIKCDGNDDDGPHDKGNLPRRKGEIGFGDVDAGLHLESDGVATTRETSQPAQRGHPARSIREHLLVFRWRKLTDPVILSARRRRHGSHLGQTGHHGRVRYGGGDKAPEDTCIAAIGEARRQRDEHKFPRRHVNSDETNRGPE
ncbi:hypothetical protein HG530_014340 [Fusarium avenaceum]|nr:hypothetical protein HG530_014340 [Fusarium avenaceum]